MRGAKVAAATLVATIAFVVYSRTLLPGLDLGDTGGFQAAVAWPETTARQAYPLYYALASPFVAAVTPDNPARGLNLFSALCGAVAIGLLAWVVAAVTRSIAGGAAAALLLAFSYTFWSQAIIAEVYTLHLALVAGSLIALHAFARTPTRGRLAAFCAIYALAFGNHLSMILLFVPFAAFVLIVHPRRRELFHPSVLAMALLIACAGALLYTPSFLATWSSTDAPPTWHERVAAFWFDVTKADWRATMILGIDSSSRSERLSMWGWDARQQFGSVGIMLAMAGAIRAWWISRAWATVLWFAYAINTAFAVTYNVGDAHVFFLPQHLFFAFAIGMVFAIPTPDRVNVPSSTVRAIARKLLPIAVLGFAVWRGWDTWPAADRHGDSRGEEVAARVLAGLSGQTDLLLVRMNWDQEDALLYAGRHERPDVAWTRLLRVLPHFPQLVADNHDIGRDIVLTAGAAATVVSAYGDFFPLVQDDVPATPSLVDLARSIPRGTPYVLTALSPVSAYPYDPADLDSAIRQLTGGQQPAGDTAAYEVVAGVAGAPPVLRRSSRRPFRTNVTLAGDPITIRMDGWLPTETFRRGGFGHVLRGREPVLFIERGVSLVWFGADGSPRVAYAGGPYAPQPRFRIPVSTTRLALR